MVPLFESKDIPGLGLIIQRRAQVPLGGARMNRNDRPECIGMRTD